MVLGFIVSVVGLFRLVVFSWVGLLLLGSVCVDFGLLVFARIY